MTTQNERLAGLIAFAKQTALLKSTPVHHVSQHKQFNRFEDKIKGLPGVTFNGREDEFDEIWLRLERLHEGHPPIPENELLSVWVELSNSPFKEPSFKAHANRQQLEAIGALSEADRQDCLDADKKQEPKTLDVAFEDFPNREDLASLLKSYAEGSWKEWCEKEKEIRKSIALYSDLFMLSQQLQGNLVDSQLELVWGIGVGVWRHLEGSYSYPLLSQLVEISFDEKTMALEIRPRATEPRVETDFFAAQGNPGVANLTTVSKKFFGATGGVLSPFEPSTFEALLKSAATFLDASGTYWPTQTTPDDRALPKLSDNLVVTDTWVLFARPRSSSLFIQDLERFERILESGDLVDLPAAVSALVTEPLATIEHEQLPMFRGQSMIGGGDAPSRMGEPAELYFPMPYNDEQVQIVQQLEAHVGVVVQGPPGTGKTHTIANVICHYLAQGKRVLVTSMKDPALAVLREKLPETIRPLAISLLTSEAEGMKQFEFAVNKIAAEVTRIDRTAYRRDVEHIDGEIDSLHGQISKADKEIANWARLNLQKVEIDNEPLSPLDVANEVAVNLAEVSWFPDTLTTSPSHKPQFENIDILALREARMTLGSDLAYLGKRIPQIGEFPETARLIQVHQDLSQLSELESMVNQGEVPLLRNDAPETVKEVMAAASKVASLRQIQKEIDDSQQSWTPSLQKYIRRDGRNEILDLFFLLKDEMLTLLGSRKQFLSKPVSLPEDLDSNLELVEAVTNLSIGKKPFGLTGLFAKTGQKRVLDSIALVSEKPASAADWGHVLRYIKFLQESRALLVRWNTLAGEISLPRFEQKPDRLMAAGLAIDLINKLVQCVSEERDVADALKPLLPTWRSADEAPYSREILKEAESILRHHLTRVRLAETSVIKDSFLKALGGCEGEITNQIQSFMSSKLGNGGITEAALKADWAVLLESLRHISSLGPALRKVREVTELIESSGARNWAKRLCLEARSGAYDPLLPDNWKEVWRLSRLVNFVDGIDGRKDLKRLAKLRSSLDGDLSKKYQDAVTKRTWLKLSENATHDVRAALEAYRSAIKKIGKGTGVRAGRYRQDARFAAERANAAIPCWIMPHYRIFESLPASFGCFDLVVIDEASQSDFTALPAILRAQKVLIVGDDKQVSPEGVGLKEDKIRNLMGRFLATQVDIYRPQMSPERSIYDLFKVVFAKSAVMLREHFRSVAPIIEYSKREFYNHELLPLRLPRMSERLDPPLVDVHMLDGHRSNDINQPEARYIVDEIKRIVENPQLAGRTIGVVSLLGNDQALLVMRMLSEEIGEQAVTKFKITCGDARTFQGKERDIMFLSMVASPGQAHAQTQDMVAQRFNVAASRARDRMYLVRSLQLEDLSQADHLRSKLIQHFMAPFHQNVDELENFRDRCESPFEREVFDLLVERGYRVVPQVVVGSYRIDMVVEGDNDSRLAIECDGDRYHGPDQWESDMRRQRTLERAGWHFWRCFASTLVMHRAEVVQDLLDALGARGIQPTTGSAPIKSIHVELREIIAFPLTSATPEEPEALLVNDELV